MGVTARLNPIRVEIKIFKDGQQERLGAVIDIADLSPGVRETITRIEADYLTLISRIKGIRDRLKASKRPILNRWFISKLLTDFFSNLRNKNVVLASRLITLARDTGFSRTEVHYLIKFYQMFPNRNLIKDNIPWSVYRALLDKEDPILRAKAMEYVMKGKLRSEYSVRHFDRFA
jgi:hypothetical protein